MNCDTNGTKLRVINETICEKSKLCWWSLTDRQSLNFVWLSLISIDVSEVLQVLAYRGLNIYSQTLSNVSICFLCPLVDDNRSILKQCLSFTVLVQVCMINVMWSLAFPIF